MSVAVPRVVPAMRVDVHLLHALDLASLYETAELGNGLPFLLLRNCQFSAQFLRFLVCAPQTCRHDGHVHGRDHGHGHHHGLHEIRIRHEREQRQPFCMSVKWTTVEALSAIVDECSTRGERTVVVPEVSAVHVAKQKLRTSILRAGAELSEALAVAVQVEPPPPLRYQNTTCSLLLPCTAFYQAGCALLPSL